MLQVLLTAYDLLFRQTTSCLLSVGTFGDQLPTVDVPVALVNGHDTIEPVSKTVVAGESNLIHL